MKLRSPGAGRSSREVAEGGSASSLSIRPSPPSIPHTNHKTLRLRAGLSWLDAVGTGQVAIRSGQGFNVRGGPQPPSGPCA